MSTETGTWTREHADTDTLEILAGGGWQVAPEDLFRSYTGRRRKNGEPYHGNVYWTGSDDLKMPAAPATAEERWEELKDYLGKTIDSDAAVFEWTPEPGKFGYGGMLTANRNTLAKMRELER